VANLSYSGFYCTPDLEHNPELGIMFHCSPNPNFRQRALDTAIAEINKKTDLQIALGKYSVKTRSGLAREYLFEIGAQGIKEDRLLWEDGLMVFLQFATAFGQPDVAPVGGAIGRAGKTG